MNNFKIQQIMKDKKTPKTEAEKADIATLLAKIRELRQQAVNKAAPDRQNTPVNGRTVLIHGLLSARFF